MSNYDASKPIPVNKDVVYIPRHPGWNGVETGGYFCLANDHRKRVIMPLADWPDELLCQQADAYERTIKQLQGEIIQPSGDCLAEEWYDHESVTDAKYRNEGEISRLMNMLHRIKAEIRGRWLAAQEMMAEDGLGQ